MKNFDDLKVFQIEPEAKQLIRSVEKLPFGKLTYKQISDLVKQRLIDAIYVDLHFTPSKYQTILKKSMQGAFKCSVLDKIDEYDAHLLIKFDCKTPCEVRIGKFNISIAELIRIINDDWVKYAMEILEIKGFKFSRLWSVQILDHLLRKLEKEKEIEIEKTGKSQYLPVRLKRHYINKLPRRPDAKYRIHIENINTLPKYILENQEIIFLSLLDKLIIYHLKGHVYAQGIEIISDSYIPPYDGDLRIPIPAAWLRNLKKDCIINFYSITSEFCTVYAVKVSSFGEKTIYHYVHNVKFLDDALDPLERLTFDGSAPLF